MKFVYGPVPSRRLGNSLGIDLLPSKTCNFQCIYCQLGKTTNFTNKRANFFPKEDIICEIREAINQYENNIDYLTFVGSGEPTLYKDIEELILITKKFSRKPVCVITNGALLYDPKVRKALMPADIVLPSLDAGDEKLFIKINRPHLSIKYDDIIQGFMEFRKEFEGKFWVEIMLIKGINDSRNELLKLKKKMDLLMPDRIDINVPIRPPAEKWVEIPDKNIMLVLNDVFGEYSDIHFPELGKFYFYSTDFENEFLSIIERHPMRQDQIIETFCSQNLNQQEIFQRLKVLKEQKKIEKLVYNNKIFWRLRINKKLFRT